MKARFKDTNYSLIEYLAKRLLDCTAAILLLFFLTPFLIIVGIIIKLDSSGPALFRQKRVGINGTSFQIFKFRTMYKNADENMHKEHILAYTSGKLDEHKGVKLEGDARVTKVGAFLRRTSIDELPQLLNVMNGTMSLVGPRPLPVYEVEQFDLWQSERLKVFPGMTGMWQIYGRSKVSFKDQLRLDIRYIRNYSIWLDIKLLFLTIPAVFSRRGAG